MFKIMHNTRHKPGYRPKNDVLKMLRWATSAVPAQLGCARSAIPACSIIGLIHFLVNTMILFKTHKYRYFALLLSLTLLLAHTASAEKQPTVLIEETFVTATRFKQPAQSVIGSADFFSKDDIETVKPYDLLEVLQLSNNVQLRRTGGVGGLGTIGLRGASSAQTLQLINGQRYGSATVGGSRSDLIAAEFIDSIEILRGSGSSLYGSDALGGVINKTTAGLKADDDSGKLGTSFGSNAYTKHYFLGKKNVGDALITLGAKKEQADGIDATILQDGTNSDKDPYERASGLFAVHLAPTNNSQLSFLSLRNTSNTAIDATFTTQDFPNTENATNEAEVTVNQFIGEHQVNTVYNTKIMVGKSRDHLEGLNTAFPFEIETSTSTVDWVNQLHFHDSLIVTLGATTEFSRVETTSALATQEGAPITRRKVDASFLQLSGAFDHLAYRVGVRNEENSQFGSQLNTDFTIEADFSSKFSMHWHYAGGFRAPTFNDLFSFFPNDNPSFAFLGNPNLKPEESQTLELGFKAQWGLVGVWVTGYQTTYDNLIANIFIENFGTTRENIEAAIIKGLETKVTAKSDYLGELTLGVDIVHGRNTTNNLRIERIPKHNFFASWQKNYGDTSLTILSQARGESTTVGSRTAGFGVVDSVLTKRINEGLTVSAKVSNILDKQYRYDARFNQEGRTFSLNADIHF